MKDAIICSNALITKHWKKKQFVLYTYINTPVDFYLNPYFKLQYNKGGNGVRGTRVCFLFCEIIENLYKRKLNAIL